MRHLSAVLLILLAAVAPASEPPSPPYPLWDGHETIAQYAKRTNLPPTKTIDLGNGVSLELVLIPAGKFIMGTPEPKLVDEEAFHKKIMTGQAVLAAGGGILLVLIAFAILRAIRERRRFQYSLRRFMAMTFAASLCVLGAMHWFHSTKALAQVQAEYSAVLARYKVADYSERPAHEVTLTKPTFMSKFLTTQEQYQQVMGTNHSYLKGLKLPVANVTWNDAQEFCEKVRKKTGQTVCLPTEAEWEFACRAGTTTTYYSGDTEADLGRVAWYDANSKGRMHPVGQKEPNAFGLHDMHGNVWEWCQDWYEPHKREAAVDPQGPTHGQYRMLRGGSWVDFAWYSRSAVRLGRTPDIWAECLGFRVEVLAPRTP